MAIEIDLECRVLNPVTFLELTDTPNTYAGQAGKYPKVNDTEDGLEFGDAVDGVQTVTGDGVGGTATDVVLTYPTPSDIGALQPGDNISTLANDSGYLTTITGSNHSQLTLNDGTNPHGTTKSDVGLGNVDNTSDLSKPISTATQTALDGKRNNISFSTETASFAPSSESDGTYINVNSASDVNATFNSGAFANDGDVVYFEQIGAGRILFTNGTASITAAPSLSLVSGGIGSIVAVIRKSATDYRLTGVTE